MKILVTGGAGFIGSAVVRFIIQETSDSVVNIDKLTYAGNLESLVRISVIAIARFGLFRSPEPTVFLSSYFYSK